MTTDGLAATRATLAGVVGGVPLVLRAVVAAMAASAIVATTLPAWDAPDGYVVRSPCSPPSCYVLAPDSASGVVFVGAIVVTWLTGAPGEVEPAVVVTALALLVGHVAAALAGAMPVTARADLGVGVRWARPTAGIAGGVLAAAGARRRARRWSLPGSAIVTVARRRRRHRRPRGGGRPRTDHDSGSARSQAAHLTSELAAAAPQRRSPTSRRRSGAGPG